MSIELPQKIMDKIEENSNEWNKIKFGYMIIGENSSDYALSTWHADTKEEAVRLATRFAENTGGAYEIIKYEFIGVVRPAKIPIEFVQQNK